MTPALPFKDNCILIDNSSLERLYCPRAFLYSFVLKRNSSKGAAALNFGSAMHLYWKVRYRGHRLSATQRSALLGEYFRRNPQDENEWRSPDLAECACTVYDTSYEDRDYKVLPNKKGQSFVEQSFLLPLGQVDGHPILYMGRIDLSVEHEGGPWIVDHKTALAYGKTFGMAQAMSAQHPGYCWAYREAYGVAPLGFGINAYRTRAPRKADEYDPTKGVRPDDFERDWHYISDEQIEEWKENTLSLLETIFFFAKQGKWPMFRHQCVGKYGPCSYYDVCSLSRSHRADMLASSAFVDNHWTPLNAP